MFSWADYATFLLSWKMWEKKKKKSITLREETFTGRNFHMKINLRNFCHKLLPILGYSLDIQKSSYYMPSKGRFMTPIWDYPHYINTEFNK